MTEDFYTKTYLEGHPVKRLIVCAANKIHINETGKTLVICGARHWDPTMHAQADAIKAAGHTLKYSIEDQGFIDQFGDYHDRKDAWLIAEKHGQIAHDVSSPGTLFSENLY